MSVVAGILVTAAVTPALAVSGMAATNTINVFENLPDYLSIDKLSQKSNIYATQADGTPVLMASFYDQNRIEVGLDKISPFASNAAIAGEDPRFYTHGGIDIQGTARATVSSVTGGATSGGSSITQQYVKNVLVQKCEIISDDEKHDACYSAATETTPDRKLKEMRLAIGVEKNFSKKDILGGYLNIALFGGKVYGIETAANYYYSTTAANLTLPQAASLIAIVNNPTKFQLDKPESETNGAANGYEANKVRRDYIIGEMLRHKKITKAEHKAAVDTPVAPLIQEPSTGCQTAAANAYFCDYVTRILKSDKTFGATEDERKTNFRRGGFNVYTTLDLDVQGAAVKTLDENVPKVYSKADLGGVITSVEVNTGRVLSMAQSKDYSQDPAVQATGANWTSVNYNTDREYGGSAGFQPGSTYKVFTLGEWLKEGHSLNERVDSKRKSDWGPFKDSCDGTQNFPGYNPRNDANEANPNYSALESTINSINTGFIGMAKKLDLCGIRSTAEAFGVHRADGKTLQKGIGAVLGTNEVAPLSMAVAYAGIANSGKTCSPIVIDRIVGSDGAELPAPKSTCTQSVDPEVAAGMTYAMAQALSTGTGKSSYGATSPKSPMIGKTGTTDSGADTWMTGSSSKVATVAGVVSINGKALQRKLNFPSGPVATARHRMWPDVMSVVNKKYGGDEFKKAAENTIKSSEVAVPDVRGKSLADAQAAIEAAGFSYAAGVEVDSELPAGTAANTEPSINAMVAKGSTVVVNSSNGSGVTIPDVVGKTEAEAKATLTAAPYSFVVDKKEHPVTDATQVGKVISTEPGAGSSAKPGSSVILLIGKLAG